MTSDKCIGKGAYGEVYEYDGKAIKACQLFKVDKGETLVIDNVLREATFYKYVDSARHASVSEKNVTEVIFDGAPEGVPRTTAVFMQDNMVFIQMPLLGSPLHKVAYVSKKVTVQIFVQVLEVCAWLHARQWSHGDLKPANILVRFEDSVPKVSVIDYGSIMFSSRFKLRSQRCTLYYVSPEELLHSHASSKSDIWSVGAVLYEFITGIPFVIALMTLLHVSPEDIHLFKKHVNDGDKADFKSGEFLRGVYKSLMYGTVLKLVMDTVRDRDLSSILAHCLVIDARARPSAVKLFKTQAALMPSLSLVENIGVSLKYNTCVDDLEGLSYRRMKHAGVDLDERKKIVQALVDQLQDLESEGEDTVFFHALMLNDRLTFRGYKREETDIHRALNLALCIILSQSILQGQMFTVEFVKSCLKVKVSSKYVHSTLQQLLGQLDLRLLNYSPDMLLELAGKVCTDDCIERSLDMAMYVPWVHSNVQKVAPKIFPGLKE